MIKFCANIVQLRRFEKRKVTDRESPNSFIAATCNIPELAPSHRLILSPCIEIEVGGKFNCSDLSFLSKLEFAAKNRINYSLW